MVNSRLDYCNALLNGAPTSIINKLQRAQNVPYSTTMVALTRKRYCEHCTGFYSLSTHRLQDCSVDVRGEEDLTARVRERTPSSTEIFAVDVVCCITPLRHACIQEGICEKGVCCTAYSERSTWQSHHLWQWRFQTKKKKNFKLPIRTIFQVADAESASVANSIMALYKCDYYYY